MNRKKTKPTTITINQFITTIILMVCIITGTTRPVAAISAVPYATDLNGVANLLVTPDYIAKGLIDNGSSLYASIPTDLLLNREPISELAWVDVDALNVRSSTNQYSDVVDILVRGQSANASEKIEVMNTCTLETETWYYVESGNTSGYVLEEYLNDEPIAEYMGDFLITYYCPCAICCEVANRATASGVMPTEGRTIAADPSIPFGTKIMIDGQIYTVEDRGGLIKGNHIDIFITDHQRCYEQPLGMQTVPVYHIL